MASVRSPGWGRIRFSGEQGPGSYEDQSPGRELQKQAPTSKVQGDTFRLEKLWCLVKRETWIPRGTLSRLQEQYLASRVFHVRRRLRACRAARHAEAAAAVW